MNDTLSEVLRAVRLTGAIFFSVEASAPWVAEAPASGSVAPYLMPGAEHVIEYHVVASGSCWGGLIDEPAVKLETGDVIVFPQGESHVLSSDPGMRGNPQLEAFHALRGARLPLQLAINGGGEQRAQLICGFVACDAKPFNPLLASLPRVIHLRAAGGAYTAFRRLVELAVDESSERAPGSDCALSRLSELLFVEVVRRYTAELPADHRGWFAGLRDDSIGRALQRLHERPAHDWSLEELAKQVGLSRSTLAERFVHFVGIPPIQYLAQWRIQLAANLLRSGKSGLAEIADRVGYGSETALSRAFKRQVGLSPDQYRRGQAEVRASA